MSTLFGTSKPGFFEKMKQAVARTRENLSARIEDLASLGKEIDRNDLDEPRMRFLRTSAAEPTANRSKTWPN